MKCRKCGGERLAVKPNEKNPSATDLYCADCGAWQKFANKDEIRLYGGEVRRTGLIQEVIARVADRPDLVEYVKAMHSAYEK